MAIVHLHICFFDFCYIFIKRYFLQFLGLVVEFLRFRIVFLKVTKMEKKKKVNIKNECQITSHFMENCRWNMNTQPSR